MVKIKKNVLIEGASGRMGDIVFKTMKNGTTYISRAPKKSKKGNTKKREATRVTFGEGVTYAQKVLASEEETAFYKKYGDKKRKVYHQAIADYKIAPEIKQILYEAVQEGLQLDIVAIDDFRVCRLTCSYVVNGEEITTDTDDIGVYTWRAVIPREVKTVVIRAYDRPGNMDEVVYSLSNI